MRIPPTSELLEIWERVQLRPLPARMLSLLGAAMPESDEVELGALPIGRRNAALLELRDRFFGPGLALVAPCPSCGSDLEFEVAIPNIRVAVPAQAELAVEGDGFRVTFRLPASDDLLAIRRDPPEQAAWALLARCVTAIEAPEGMQATIDAVPPSLVAAIDARMADADPQADMHFDVVCPSCAYAWSPIFDIANVFWKEIHTWAKDILRNVHSLARVYAWREADILALSPTRRRIYLELARS